jgi:integrase/recombinase XerC
MSTISADVRARQTSLIDAWLTDLRVRDRADSTIDLYAEILRRAHTALPYGLAGSTTEELQAWIWTPGRAAATRKLYRAAVCSFFRWAADGEHLDFDPARLLPAVTVRAGQVKATPQDVLGDILAKARDPFRLWILLAAAMGLRCVEISRLDREHVAEDRTWIQGKGGRDQYLPTHPVVWLAVADLPPGPLVIRTDGTRATRKDVYTRANMHIRRLLGHSGVTMHQLRRYHGTMVYRVSGRDLMLAKEALRHTSVAHTQRYIETDDTELVTAQRAIPLPI